MNTNRVARGIFSALLLARLATADDSGQHVAPNPALPSRSMGPFTKLPVPASFQVQSLPGHPGFVFTMYGVPEGLEARKQLVHVMRDQSLGNGFDPGPSLHQYNKPTFDHLASLGWPVVCWPGGDMQIKGGRCVLGPENAAALASMDRAGVFTSLQLGEWGYYFHNLAPNEGWWRAVYGKDLDQFRHLMKPAGLAGYDRRPTNRRECYEVLQDYFTSRSRDLLGRVISVTGHSHYEAYVGEWGARCIGLEVGENIAFTQSKFAFARGASRQWQLPWSVQVSPWFSGACTTSGPLRKEGGDARGLDAGHSVSFYERIWLHSWFAGAAMVTPENSSHIFFEQPSAPWTLTEHGRKAKEVFRFTKEHERGVPFTPVAIVLDHLAGYNAYMDKPWGILEPTAGDRQVRDLFDYQLFPGSDHIHHKPDPDNPEASYLRPTPYGEMFDVQLTSASAEMLASYPDLLLAGDITFDDALSATLVSKGTEGAGSSDWAILGGAADGKDGCVISRPGPKGGNDVVLASPEKVNDGAWHHVVWTRSADGENKLYVDGGLAASYRDSGGAITNDRPIQIGGDPWLGGKSFSGEMAEIAIYRTVLTAERVTAHVKAAGIEPKKFSVAQTTATPAPPPQPLVLKADDFRHYIDSFNQDDHELYKGYFPNAAAWDFLKDNIPLLDCPDEDIQTTYYFRWWTYRKHIKQTPAGFIVDEFLPNVAWAGKYNSISCAAGHHLHEGRWLRDPRFLDDYSKFWFRGGGEPRRYSFWVADAIWARRCVTGDKWLPLDLLPDLIANYEAWETSHRDPNGLYWQIDDRDGMEVSIGGSGCRATINSYQFGDALAIARIAELAGQTDVAREYREKAASIKRRVQEELWDPDTQFFKVLPRGEDKSLASVRELHGFTPWYFNLPDPQFAVAWKQVLDPHGFFAPFGPTTAEQRCPNFAVAYVGHECQWNGPSWPFSTAVTLTGLANLLNGPAQDAIVAKDFLDLLRIYAKSHRLQLDDGRVVPWIDENLNPSSGDWISRTRLKCWKNGTWDAGKGGEERGKDYNHSTFCDLVISGLIGLRPRADDTVEVNPLVPPSWDYCCLDQIPYHGYTLTILFDKTGQRYGKGQGRRVFANGIEIAASEKLARVTGPLPPLAPLETSAGWQKFEGNPVMGGKHGTCFDISVLRDGDKYRMWLSWRPKQSVALVESKDGIHWSEPPQVVLGPRKESAWEDDINRPCVLKRGDTYHMWYTGQVKPGARDGHSWIGYATSPDGVTWKRLSDRPVLSFDQPWETNTAVMCPSMMWDESTKCFRMWYSGGEQNEPNAIGYATSPDGITWKKYEGNPVFGPEPKNPWEQHKVAGVQVEKHGDWYLMFYIGYQDEPSARICLARSQDGITNWQRHPANPIIFPGKDKWDHDACYKPYAIFDGTKWLLWYNGRHGGLEQIGVALHAGEDLGFSQ